MPITRQLNQGQIDVLAALYKFRFGTRELIAASLGKQNGNPIYSRLSILEQRGLVDKRFESSYKLNGRAAEYYLTPSGLRALRELVELDGLDDKAIKASYKDRTASDQFLQRNLAIYAIGNALAAIDDGLNLFTKRELTEFDYFPKQLPDAYISRKIHGSAKSYFLELFMADMPPFAIDRRLRQFIAYYENGEWSVTETPFPAILCICENDKTEKRVMKQAMRALKRSDTDILLYMTTLPAITTSREGSGMLWSSISEPEKIVALPSL